MRSERLEGLDLLRGVAALLVFLLHLRIANKLPDWPFDKAYLAVDLFFMLSGYVLTRTYHTRFIEGLGPATFLKSRVKRLWPTVALGTMLGLVCHLMLNSMDGSLLAFLAMQLAWIPLLTNTNAEIFPLNIVVWSIFFEMFANLLHATVLWQLSRSRLVWVIGWLGLVMIVTAVRLGDFDLGITGATFVFGFPRVLLSYLVGCWLYLSFRDEAPFNVSGWLASVALIGALAIGWLMEPAGWLFDSAFVLLVCPLVLLIGLNGLGAISRIGTFLGSLSFPLYAVHVPIILMVDRSGWHWVVAVPLAIVTAGLVAAASRSRLMLQPGSARWSPLSASRRGLVVEKCEPEQA